MAESLYLQLPRDAGPFRWLRVDTLGNRIGSVQQGTLAEAALEAPSRRLCVLLPGEHVTLTHVDVPSRNPQKVLQAVPFLLEDKLAEDVESLHFALGTRTVAGQLVAVIGRSRLRACLDELSAAGLQPIQLVPDVTALAPQAGAAAVALDGNTALVRLPDGSGYSADTALAAQMLKRRAAGDSAALARVDIHGTSTDIESFDAALGDTPLERVKHPAADGALPALAAGLGIQRGLDLMQGEFKIQTHMQEHWRTWRVAVVLLGVCLLLGLAQQVTSYVKLRRQATALDAQVAQLFSQAMPGSRLVTGSEQQEMKAKLAELQGGNSAGSLLALLDVLGTGLSNNPSIQVTGISYQGGSLQAQLQASDIGALDALKGALNQNGVKADLDSVNASGSQVTGRLVLSGATS